MKKVIKKSKCHPLGIYVNSWNIELDIQKMHGGLSLKPLKIYKKWKIIIIIICLFAYFVFTV